VSTQDFSNAVRLSSREWVAVAAFALLMLLFTPVLWTRVERFEPGPDYRIPEDLGNDYWLYDRFARVATGRCDTILVGDSVVWGPYVRSDQTLSHALNDLAGASRFANLGLDGAEPVALRGLVEHYGAGVRGRTVLLHCNPLWLSSPLRDLRETDERRFSHPRLIPQLVPSIPSYREAASPRIGILVEQRVPFISWANHLQQAYFEKMDIPSWTLEHPDSNPLRLLTEGLPPAADHPQHEAIPWNERGIKPQDFAWVDLGTSLQWSSFVRTIEILKARDNAVFVLVGPFNEHMLTDKSRRSYGQLKADIAAQLRARGVAFLAPPPLPSELYGDASHPLAAGYVLLAKQVLPLLDQSSPARREIRTAASR
jgi:hypothetical protein